MRDVIKSGVVKPWITRNIALVAHDNQKAEILDWSRQNRRLLSRHNLFATGTTGSLLAEALDLPVNRYFIGKSSTLIQTCFAVNLLLLRKQISSVLFENGQQLLNVTQKWRISILFWI
jgi:methylglyoxal synthase